MAEYFSRDEYAGLKDENGVEIYEGDILDISLNESKGFVIFWNERCAEWYVKEPATGWIEFLAPGLGNRHTNQDVTGGIYSTSVLIY